jgi:hypothetical protein
MLAVKSAAQELMQAKRQTAVLPNKDVSSAVPKAGDWHLVDATLIASQKFGRSASREFGLRDLVRAGLPDIFCTQQAQLSKLQLLS